MGGYTSPGKVFLIEHLLIFNTTTSYNPHILSLRYFSKCVYRKDLYLHPQYKVKHFKQNVVREES